MKNEQLSVRILMKKSGKRYSDFTDIVSSHTLSRILKGDRFIKPDTLDRIAVILGASDYLKYLYALDQVYLECRHHPKFPENFSFPDTVPKDIRYLMMAMHPLFQ